MSALSCDETSLVRVTASTLGASDPDATQPLDELASPLPMRLFRESREHRIQRWIGDQGFAYASSIPGTSPATDGDPEEQQARQEHDHLADLDWEVEEFEREMALRFVMRDLKLGLEERSVRKPSTVPPNLNVRTRRSRWTRSPSSTSTLQPGTPVAPPSATPPPTSSLTSPPSSSASPRTPTAPPISSHAVPASPLSPYSLPDSPTPHSARPTSLLTSLLRPPHKSSPSVLSLPTSHFSSCTNSSDAPPSISARSFASQVGKKIKHSFVLPPVPSPPRPKPVSAIPGPTPARKRRRVSVPASLGPKKRRLVVKGIAMDDEYAVEGVKRWADGLGEVSRMSRSQDGAIWIEFQDRRVANDVCCLQAQVQIPHVGRVVLDWAEGRHPG